jgi:hypothetical protein
MVNLFQTGSFMSHAALTLPFKIECDALSDDDIRTLAFVIGGTFHFQEVRGVPTGGLRLADALKPYAARPPSPSTYIHECNVLIVDDVLTTGASVVEIKRRHYTRRNDVLGCVIFARGPCPNWVYPIFQMGRDFWPTDIAFGGKGADHKFGKGGDGGSAVVRGSGSIAIGGKGGDVKL